MQSFGFVLEEAALYIRPEFLQHLGSRIDADLLAKFCNVGPGGAIVRVISV